MRLATALFLAAVPTSVMAQPARQPAAIKPHEHKLIHGKPVATRPAAVKTPAHPPAAGHKLAQRKPAATKPATKPVAAKPPPTVAAAPAKPPPDLHKGSNTGLPLPRFAALKTDDVNFRVGPGARYPIAWVYKRRDLPVEIEREFEVWRLVTDPNGSKGWVQAVTLTGRRTAVITGGERILRQGPSETAGPVARLESGVIVRVHSCEAQSEWCQVQINDYRGYIKRSEVWGLLPNEAIP